jgi:hypothetical protein
VSTDAETTIRPILERTIPGTSSGEQHIYRFENGYGASVIRGGISYGHEEGLWELAVVTFEDESPESFRLCYRTPITSDVEGHLSADDVGALLARIRDLPPVSP